MARKTLYPPSIDPGLPVPPPVPAGWICVTFGDVVEPFYRRIALAPDREYAQLIAKRNRGGIELRRRVTGEEILTKAQFEAHAGDFLISRRQIIHGACGVVPEELNNSIVSGEYSTLRTQQGLLMDFLRHYSHTSYFQRTCFHSSHGVDVEKMVFKLERWLQWPVVLPPLGEQRKIAAILSSVDEAIEKTQAVIDQVQVVKKGLMQELLTKGLPGRHEKFKQTEIGEIPESWDVLVVGDVIHDTQYGTSAKCDLDESQFPVLRIPNVAGGRISLTDLKYTAATASEVARYEVFTGDILMIRTNGNPNYVACTAVVPVLERPHLFASYLIRLRVDQKRMAPAFLHLVLAGSATRKRLQGVIRTSAGNYNINAEGIRHAVIPVPPLPEQEAISEYAGVLQSRVDSEAQTMAGLIQLKTALMATLLTGETRVTP